jgi:hypothetical protein
MSNQGVHAATILLAGGCHVSGFKGCESSSLAGVLQERLDRADARVHIHPLPHTRLPHRRRILSAVKETSSDLVVLQLGHAELNQSLSTYLRSRLARHGASSSPSDDSDSIAYVLARPRIYYFRADVKAMIDRLLFHPLVNWQRVLTHLDLLLSDLTKKSSVPVVLLSPMPCADPTRMYYRRRAFPLFRAAAEKHGCHFLDVLSGAPRARQKSFGPQEYFLDGIHLGVVGQQAVGSVIAEHILSHSLHALRKAAV